MNTCTRKVEGGREGMFGSEKVIEGDLERVLDDFQVTQSSYYIYRCFFATFPETGH
jgi:hypothetical protein